MPTAPIALVEPDSLIVLTGAPSTHGTASLLTRLGTAAKVAIGLLAAYFLLTHLSQITAAAGAFARSDPFWIAGALALAGLSYVLDAWTLAAAAATHLRLPFGRTVAAQLAAASANRLSPAGLGGMGVNVRYLEACGSSRSAALGAIGVGKATGFAVRLILIVGLALVTHQALPLHLRLWPGWWLAAASTGVLTVGGVALWRGRVLDRLASGASAALAHIGEIAAQPRRLAVLLVGSAGVSIAHAGALAACVAAVGGHLGLTDALFIYLAGSAVSAVAPSPGGVGVVEASLVAGLGHLGIASGVALAGVFSYRLATYWLPVLPGLMCAGALRRRHAI